MRTTTILAVAAALLFAAIATAGAQPPRPVPPKDPATPIPTWSLESLWQEIDCDCECDCCKRIKQLIKERTRDPKGRPMLAPRSDDKKPRIERRKGRVQRPRHTPSMWDQRRPRGGDRRHHKRLEAIDLRAALEKEMLELKRLLHSDNVNDDQLRKQVDAMARIRADLEFNRLKNRLEWRRALTDEQRDKLKKRGR